MFLITTADENTWKFDEKVLFLGEWCTLYSRRHVWSKLNYEVLPYHWDDRVRLYVDFKRLTCVYEKYLALLSKKLNLLHNCNYSDRYWRIVIGPWLRYFLDVIYDRYSSIKSATERCDVSSTLLLSPDLQRWVPKDMYELVNFSASDAWNAHIYGEIIRRVGVIKCEMLDTVKLPKCASVIKERAFFKKLLRKGADIYQRILPDFFNNVVFIASYFSKSDLAKLQLSLGQLPCPYMPMLDTPAVAVSASMRQSMVLANADNEFEVIFEALMVQQMPTSYLEGYNALRINVLEVLPKHPKVIYTANAFANNDDFKMWSAEKIEMGARLVVGQHGGNYGMGLWSQSEDHQIAISDAYFSWGWQDCAQSKIRPLPAGKLVHQRGKIRPNSKGPILWALYELPRYSVEMYSVPVASQFLSYLEEQFQFAQTISQPVLDLLQLRQPHALFGWDIESRFNDAGFGQVVYRGNKNFVQHLQDCRICVATYNATTCLETLAANYPTLMFWNPNHWELRPAAQPYFDELRRVGLLHDTPQSAAGKLNEIYDNVQEWWFNLELQEVRRKFCQEFARNDSDWKRMWKNELHAITKVRVGHASI